MGWVTSALDQARKPPHQRDSIKNNHRNRLVGAKEQGPQAK
jgi:hypothetical protein